MNLLFIFTDQQNRYALGCMDNPNIETPNLDRLASRGTLYRRCYSNNPVCGPFRGSLLTGQYTSHCGVERNGAPLPEGTTTFADAFNEGGYATSWVGKWHLGGSGNAPIAEPLRGGFQEFIGYQCYNGFNDNVCFYDEAGEEHRFDRHRTDVTTDLAIERLEGLAAGPNPFLMMISYQAPHYPEQPALAYAEQYAGREILRRPNCQDIDPYTLTWSPPSPKPKTEDPDYQRYGNDLDEYLRLYNAMCTQIDDNIGRLLETLDRTGIADDTAILFTSDHGDMQGSHGLKNKCLPYEESAGIPLIIYLPGAPAGRVSDALVSGIDMMPTFLDLAGISPVTSVDGQSFASVVRGESERGCDSIIAENGPWCMIVKGPWKLVADREHVELKPTLMFNLDDDPYELKDRLADAEVVAKREELLSELSAWHRNVRTAR